MFQPYGFSSYVRTTNPDLLYEGYESTALMMGSAEDGDEVRWSIRGRNIALEGVYALQSVAEPSCWMYLPSTDCNEPATLISYGQTPAYSFARSGLWKISRYQESDYFIIRPMMNNYLAYALSDAEMLTKYVHMMDERMDLTDTYSIYFDNGTFRFQPYGHTEALCVSSSSPKQSPLTVESNAGTRAQWKLQQYIGPDRWGAEVFLDHAVTAGDSSTVRIDAAYTTYSEMCYTTPSVSGTDLVSFSYRNAATVSDNRQGTVTGHDEGTFILQITFERLSFRNPEDFTVEANHYYTVALPFAEGKYFFQNRALGNYMQVDDNDKSNNYQSQAAILEMWDFTGEAHQKWDVLHVRDGYYRIVSLCGNKVVSIPTGSLNQEDTLWQAFDGNFEYQHWKFEKTAVGSYVIRPQSGEGYAVDWCMGVNNGILTANGRNVVQRAYANDSDYKDEWYLRICTSAYSIGGEFHAGSDVVDAAHSWRQCGHSSHYNIDPSLDYFTANILNSSVVYFSSHGSQHRLSLLNNIFIGDGRTAGNSQTTVNIRSYNLSNVTLYIYDACKTASFTDGSNQNLCTATVDAEQNV